MDDGPNITKKLGDFIGQVNNLLCFFGKLSSDVKARLFRSYCGIFRIVMYLIFVLRGAKVLDVCGTCRIGPIAFCCHC